MQAMPTPCGAFFLPLPSHRFCEYTGMNFSSVADFFTQTLIRSSPSSSSFARLLVDCLPGGRRRRRRSRRWWQLLGRAKSFSKTSNKQQPGARQGFRAFVIPARNVQRQPSHGVNNSAHQRYSSIHPGARRLPCYGQGCQNSL